VISETIPLQIGSLNFSLSSAEAIAFLSVLLFPMALIIIARILFFKDRNALQFFVTTISIFCFWVGGIIYTYFNGTSLNEILSSFMIFFTSLLVYLEIWALLSRGYTLGILLTLSKSSTPLNDKNLAQAYRQGEGLQWLIQHRFSGLFSAKLLFQEKNKICLTPFFGNCTVKIYKLFILMFNLKKTG